MVFESFDDLETIITSYDPTFLNNVGYVLFLSHGCYMGISQDHENQSIHKTISYNLNHTIDFFRIYCPNLRIFYAGVCNAGLYMYTAVEAAKNWKLQCKDNSRKLPGGEKSTTPGTILLIGYHGSVEMNAINWDIEMLFNVLANNNHQYNKVISALGPNGGKNWSQFICYQIINKKAIFNDNK